MSATPTKEDAETSDVPSKGVADDGIDDSKQDNDKNNDKNDGGTSHNKRDTQQQQQQQQQHSNFGQQQQRRSLAVSKSLFVTGFAHAINKIHVERLFSKFGRTERISEFMTSQKSTASSRYCFVEYDSIESAQKAMDNLHGRTLLRKRLVVLPAKGSSNNNSSSGGTTAVPMNPAKERILIDKKIAALKKKLKESSQSD